MMLLDGTVPCTNSLLDGTVLSTKSLLDGTITKVKVSISFPHPLKAPLSATPKVPGFCSEVEGNSVP